MAAFSIVEHLDIVEHVGTRLIPGPIADISIFWFARNNTNVRSADGPDYRYRACRWQPQSVCAEFEWHCLAVVTFRLQKRHGSQT